jgi:hypothetical protein
LILSYKNNTQGGRNNCLPVIQADVWNAVAHPVDAALSAQRRTHDIRTVSNPSTSRAQAKLRPQSRFRDASNRNELSFS